MRKLASLSLVLALLCLTVSADTSTAISVTAGAVTQDFNTLNPPSTTPAGWGFVETGTNANAAFSTGTGSSNTGDTYSFGATGSSDRALGGLQSGSLVPTIGARFVNNTGGLITSLAVTYTGEQWRLGTAGRADRIDFQISTNATSLTTGTWVDVNTLDFNSPNTTAAAGLLDGNLAANRTTLSATISGLSIPNTAEFFVRWASFDASGADDGLAIDDFSMTANGGDDAPAVAAVNPPNNAVAVAVDSTIVVTFNESVSATSSAFLLSCGGTPQALNQSASPATTFTLTPVSNLPFSAACGLTVVATEITDADAQDPPNTMAANFTSVFQTANAADNAPFVTTTSPANGAIDVAHAANIVVNFSEPVTATTSAFTIECGSLVAFGQTSGANSTFVLDPNVALPASAQCSVTVQAAEVSDLDTNDPPDHPAANFLFSFTTAPPPPATVFINEVDADTPGAGFDLAEFVELYDGGAGNTSLNGLSVVFYNGSDDRSYYAVDLDGFTTNPSGYFTLGNPGVAGVDITFAPGDFGFLQNGADAVAVVAGNATSYPNGTLVSSANVIDAVVYDTDDADDPQLLALLNGGQPQVNENASGDGPNQSSGRCADGTGGLRNTSTYRQGVPSPDGPNNCPTPIVSAIVISQFYGSGGNANAVYQNDYVELYNRGTAVVDVTGWSLQYASATGTSWEFGKTPLGGPIAPGEYYLVKLATNDDTVGAPLPAPNVSGTINMSGTNGKIALLNSFDSLLGECPISNAHLMDLVGYGSATCGEGGTKAPALSAATADFRLNGGATDTNRNLEDFTSGAPNPRRTAPITELGPFLVGSDPSVNGTNVPRDPTVVFTFSEPVFAVGQFFDLTCAVSGQHNSYSLAGSGPFLDATINVDLTPGETCTITLFKDQVHDQDTDDAPGKDTLPGNYQWSFTVASGTPPPFPSSVHLTFGNPTEATADLGQPLNYLMEKPEFALSYNRELGRPNWVSWHLSTEWTGTLTRVDTFRADPRVPDDPDWYRVQGFDFSGSGFDRGHMVPNADRDKETSSPINQATFLMTNMVAQAPGNNQGPWAALENELRSIAGAGNDLYIVAGPQGEGGFGSSVPRILRTTIANGHVSVPANTWKAALVVQRLPGGGSSPITCATRTIAVIMPNDDAIRPDDWHDYLVSVDDVETLTGYDLFENLPDAVEYCVEAGVNGENPPADVAPPVVQCGAADGVWHGDNVAIACTASDSESGLAHASDASFSLVTLVPSDTDSANASTDSRVVCDAVGNCVTAGPIAGNMIDRKAPAIAVASPLNGGVYQFNKPALAAFSCADGGAGLATCTGTVANGAAFDTASMGTKSFVVTATDAVGNTSSTTVSYSVEAGKIKPNPAIIITNIPANAVVGGSFTPVIAYSGDGTTHLRSETPSVCLVHGDTSVIFVGAGTCTVSAWATPSGGYARVDGPFQSFVVQ